jgi:3-hydroxyisobutyrate dehydrogenase-like beta-hydroxyacid dehydrogenase
VDCQGGWPESAMTSLRIHVLGLGKMGLPMAALLQKAGHRCSGSDPSAERSALAGALCISVINTAEVIGVEVFVSSLPDDRALLSVAEALCASGSSGAIWIDTSTVSAQTSARAAEQCEHAGVRYLRATVSGNNHMMEAAQVTVMASGPRALYDEMLPVLQCFGPKLFYLGAAEESRLMKLVINLMIVQTSSMLAEALTLGQKGGLDWQNMWEVIAASAVGSPIVKAKAVQLSQRDFSPTFTVPQMLKDVDLMLGEADRLQVPLPQTALTRQSLLACMAQGLASEDYASIIRVCEAAAGIRA